MNTRATRSVRRATPADAATLARLRFDFRSGRQTAVEAQAEFVARCAEWMRPRLHADSRWRVWLLEQGGEPIGNLWMQMIEKIPNPGTESELYGYVTNVYVLEAHRNTGGGSMLVEAALDECRRFHVETVFLWTSDEGRPLYARHGFRAADSMLVATLDPFG